MVQPTFVTNKKMFVHLDCNSYAHFEFGDESIKIEVREKLQSIYVGRYETYENLMESLTSVIGRQSRLPEWVFDGMMLGIQDGSLVCDEKLSLMQNKGAAINGIWAQEWEGQRITKFGKQLFWNWEYDKKLYQALPMFIEKCHQNQVNFLGYIIPFLEF